MVTDLEQRDDRHGTGLMAWVVLLDVTAKVVLVLALARVAVDPAWGNLEGKSPTTRAVTYPMLAFVVPVGHLWLRSGRPYPWVADLLVTLPAFSDILGNRFDLFDRVVWFDDLLHFVATGPLAFVTRSSEIGTAYADTVGDLTLGWAGGRGGSAARRDPRAGHPALARASRHAALWQSLLTVLGARPTTTASPRWSPSSPARA